MAHSHPACTAYKQNLLRYRLKVIVIKVIIVVVIKVIIVIVFKVVVIKVVVVIVFIIVIVVIILFEGIGHREDIFFYGERFRNHDYSIGLMKR